MINETEYNDFIRKNQKIAKEQGVTVSQLFLQNVSKQFKKVEKRIPYLWKAIMSKKYLLPEYRQQDYVNQDVYSYLMLSSIIASGRGESEIHGSKRDEVALTQYVSFLRQIECDRPTYWLEKELAGPMLRTKLPDDFLISDVNWRWPCFRVYLPKGLLTIERDNQISSVVYLDILQVKKDESYTLPDALKMDLWTLGAFLNPAYKNAFNGFAVSGILDMDGPYSAIGYSGTSPLDDMTIKKVMGMKGHDLNKYFPSDSTDDDLVHRIVSLGLNILMFMSSYPLEYDIDPSKAIVRKPKKEGDRTIPGLYRAKFVGESMVRPKKWVHAEAPHGGSDYTIGAHWVSGHWKRIWFGLKKGQSRLQWIGLYHTGKADEVGEAPADKPV